MSSGFVSGGTVDNPVERDDEWRQAQAELEAARKAKADLAAQHDGKSLFEVLQANKDKKQAEFEERARYKLHVSLDDEEADYLREIEEKKRKEEEIVRKDTFERLEAFRRQKEEAENKALEDESVGVPKDKSSIWAATGRKRKKGPETGLLKGVKLRKASSEPVENETVAISTKAKNEQAGPAKGSMDQKSAKSTCASSSVATAKNSSAALAGPKSTQSLSLGLGYASSDDED